MQRIACSEGHFLMQVLDLDLPGKAAVLGAVLDTRPGVKPTLHVLVHECIKSYDVFN